MTADRTALPTPPQLALQVHVGLGKSSAAREAIAELLHLTALAERKVIYAVPRHRLGQEQVEAFEQVGISAMLWRGRSAADPTSPDPDKRMCLDLAAVDDAMLVERNIEETVCSQTKGGVRQTCAFYDRCGYQAQKQQAAKSQVIVVAHDLLFHSKPSSIGEVGLLVLDEAFWKAGLRGADEPILITVDGLQPVETMIQCYGVSNRPDWDATADLAAAREALWGVVMGSGLGPLRLDALQNAGLTSTKCRQAVGLEHRRLRDPDLRPGMDAETRRARIAHVLPRKGEPWVPPKRAAVMWRLIADALDGNHDAGGVEISNEHTPDGTIRCLRLRWRVDIRAGWGADGPVLHLDATLSPDLVRPFLPAIEVADTVMAIEPYSVVRQIIGAPTSAKALTPRPDAPQRDRTASGNNLRDVATLIKLRAIQLRGRGEDGVDVLVIGQAAAIQALVELGLPDNVDTIHFNGLSGLDRWRNVGGIIVIGRTLPSPSTVEGLALAIRNQPTATAQSGWWYGSVGRRIGMADGSVREVLGETHPDGLVEALRWQICEAELVQAIGRGRGVNRTADTPLEIDLLSDVVLPIMVDEVLTWKEIGPTRHDAMMAQGVELENAADMARCFPWLWRSHDAVRQDRRSVRNCYYRDSSNSKISHSSVCVTYRLAGAGQKDRRAQFDLELISDPRGWLEGRLGRLAYFDVGEGREATDHPQPTMDDAAQRLWLLADRLDAAMTERIANDRARLAILVHRLDQAARAKPVAA